MRPRFLFQKESLGCYSFAPILRLHRVNWRQVCYRNYVQAVVILERANLVISQFQPVQILLDLPFERLEYAFVAFLRGRTERNFHPFIRLQPVCKLRLEFKVFSQLRYD